MTTFKIYKRPSSDPATAVIQLVGELDLLAGPILRDEVAVALTDGTRNLVLDVSHLTFCDATGIGVLLAISRRCRQRTGWLRLAGPRGSLVRLMTLIGLDGTLPRYPDVPRALNAPDPTDGPANQRET